MRKNLVDILPDEMEEPPTVRTVSAQRNTSRLRYTSRARESSQARELSRARETSRLRALSRGASRGGRAESRDGHRARTPDRRVPTALEVRTNEIIAGQYKRYKRGTQKILDWLVDTANLRYDLRSIIQALNDAADEVSGRTEIVITTPEIIKLAEAIVSSTPPVDVPSHILFDLRDVITYRKECSNWYRFAKNDEFDGMDGGHRFFTRVLEDVCKMLSDAAAKRTTELSSHSDLRTTAATGNQLGIPSEEATHRKNSFSCLELEEPASGLPSPPSPKAPQTPSQTMRARLKKEDEDAGMFATWCFLRDLNDVRQFVLNTWKDFCTGKVSFVTASMVAETAFGLLSCADAEFHGAHGLSTNFEDMARYLGFDVQINDNVGPMLVPKSERGLDPSSSSSVLCPDGFAVAGFGAMQLYVYRTKRYRPLVRKDDHLRYQKLSECIETSKNFTEIFRHYSPKPTAQGLLDLFEKGAQQICDTITFWPGGTHDIFPGQFLLGIWRCQSTPPRVIIPMWLCYATQIYLDIYQLLGPDNVPCGVDFLRDTCNNLTKALQGTPFDLTINLCPNCLEDDEIKMTTAYGNQYWELTKSQLQARCLLGCSTSMLEKCHPLLAGSALDRAKDKFHTSGCAIANTNMAIFFMAYLYRSLRVLGLLQAEWHDVDFAIARQSLPGKPWTPKFKGPCSVKTIYDKVARNVGVQIVRGRYMVRDTAREPADEAYHLKPASKVAHAIHEFREKTNNAFNPVKTLEYVLHDMTRNMMGSAGEKTQPPDGDTDFSPVQLLSTYKDTFISEEPHRNFDYISLSVDCLRLFGKIRDATASRLKGFAPTDEPMSSECLPSRVLRELLSHTLSLEQRHIPLTEDSLPIVQAANMVREHISERGGNRYLQSAFDQSSGHIPKRLHPSFGKEAVRRAEELAGVRNEDQRKGL
ncbi:hypothetical protein B0H66DRAFT_590683 [Apodospora peruviana]|uniref:DUF6604 domain-containing protein n=1 Tax=Apodospora peruviana TaxID=516989 RepID=A0AAE0IDM2_9PEZI|nr:hypothetical protein B0H66DRAFT_590683 [Apodospora peruviana]